jgi:urea transport system permease protein
VGFILERILIFGGWATALSAAVGGAVLGFILDITLIKRFYGRPRGFYGRPLDTLLLTWGVGLILQQLARDFIDTRGVQVPSPGWLIGGARMGSVQIPYNRMFIFGVAAACLVAIWFYLNQSGAGRRTRAVVQNRELAACMGVATGRVDQLTFFIGSGLAGAAGVTLTLVGSINPTIGTNYIVDAFLVVVVGGLGQLRGAVLAAFGLGLLNGYSEFWTDASLAKVIVFVAIVAFLQGRPQGLFQLRTRALT